MWNTAYRCYGFRINSYIMARWYLNAFMFDFRSLWCSCNEKKRINFTIFGQNGEKNMTTKEKLQRKLRHPVHCSKENHVLFSAWKVGFFFQKKTGAIWEKCSGSFFFQYWKIQITGQRVRHVKPMKMRCDRLLLTMIHFDEIQFFRHLVNVENMPIICPW